MSDLSGTVSLDISNYKANITELNRQIKLIESGFKASSSALGDWGTTASGLEMRTKSLSSEIELQKQKVSNLQQVYDQLSSSGSASSKELEELQIKINKETESLNNSQNELESNQKALNDVGNSSNTTGNDVQKLGEKEDSTKDKTSAFSKSFELLGKGVKGLVTTIAGLAGVVTGLGGAITGLVVKESDSAKALETLSTQTGLSTDKLQVLTYVGDQLGVSQDYITSSMAKLIKSMSSAEGGTGKASDAFSELGVSLFDSNDELRSNQDVFNDTIAALKNITDPTERDALAMEIFGKSAQDLNPLIEANTGQLADLESQAYTTGAVMSSTNVNALANFKDQLDSLKDGLAGTAGTLASAFLPGLSSVMTGLGGYGTYLAQIVSSSNGDLGKMASGLGDLLQRLVSKIAESLPKFLSAGLSIIQGIITAIISNLPQLLQVAISIVSTLVQFIFDNIPLLINAAVQIVTTLVNGILPQLPDLIDAALMMIVTLVNGIAQALPQLMTAIVQIIPQVITVLLTDLPFLIKAALAIIQALADGLIQCLPILLQSLPGLVIAVVNAIIVAAPILLEAALEIITTLITGLINNIPTLLEAVANIIYSLYQYFTSPDTLAQFSNIGTQFVQGLQQGFLDKWKDFIANIGTKFSDMISYIKGLLGIHSPSTLFAEMGGNMALGLSGGWNSNFEKFANQVKNGFSGLSANLSYSANGTAGVSGAQTPMSNPITININADINKLLDMDVLANKVAGLLAGA